MSLAGRNAVKGSRCEAYRPTESEGTGGQTTITWVPAGVFSLELHTPTDEAKRQVFGAETQVECTAFVTPFELAWTLEERDALVVTDGRHAGKTFRVTGTRENGKVRELALDITDEAIPS